MKAEKKIQRMLTACHQKKQYQPLSVKKLTAHLGSEDSERRKKVRKTAYMTSSTTLRQPVQPLGNSASLRNFDISGDLVGRKAIDS